MQRPSFCQHCGKRFPALHQYNNCDECGQPIPQFQAAAPMGMGASVQSLDSSNAGGTSTATILIIGLISIIAISLIAFGAIKFFSGDSSETTNTSLPTAQFIGMDINGTPGKVNYLILRISNPSSREAFTVSGQDLTIFYQDESGNFEEVSYPAVDTGVGLIADARDTESIDACSELADQPNNMAIWCFVNDGFSPSIAPGMSGDIYVFLGGLRTPLREDIEFSIELIASNLESVITAKGTTPRVFQLPATAGEPTPTPAPTAQLVVTSPEIPISPTAPPLQPPPAILPPAPPVVLPPAPPVVLPPGPTATVTAPTPTATAPLPTPTAQPVALLPLPPVNTMPRPHGIVGVARINGTPAPTGTKITAWVDGYDAPVATTDVGHDGNFTLVIMQHGVGAQAVLYSGQTSLNFKIQDKKTPQTTKWFEGNVDIFNLETN